MGNHPSKASADSQTTETLNCGLQGIRLCKSSTPDVPNDDRAVSFWECTTCGRRCVDPAVGFFITPPPTTECIMIQTDETWTHAKGGFVNLSIAGGATCDYVRVNRVEGKIGLGEQVAEPEDAVSAMTNMPVQYEVSAQALDNTASMKAEGEHGRISRVSGAVDAACDEEDPEDCEFWKARCEEIDCIYEGDHCRYQCAMAELDEEPKFKAPIPKCRLRFLRSAP